MLKTSSKEHKNTVPTLSKFKEEVLRYCKTNLRPKTTEIYERAQRILIEQLGDISLKRVLPTDLESYKNKRLITVSKTTVNMEVRTLKTIFALAVKWNYLKTSPAGNLKQIRIPDKEYLCFSKEELSRILSLTKDKVFRTLVLFAYFSGCRSSEICNTQWSDLDLDKGLIRIRNKPDFSTKTGKERTIPMNEELRKELIEYKKSLESFRTLDSSDYVFLNNDHTKFNKDIISKRFKRIIRRAGLPNKFHFHHLRHTSLTDMVQEGVNLYNVKEIAGHSSIKTTEQYLHASPEQLQRAVNKLSLAASQGV